MRKLCLLSCLIGCFLGAGCEKKLPVGYLTQPLELDRALRRGLDPNATDAEGKTLLHHASSMNLVAVIEVLCKHGANIAAKDNEGRTALYEACLQGWPDAVGLLVEKGCPVNTHDIYGWTPLHEACQWKRGTVSVIDILLKNGADIDARGNQEKTPLNLAIDINNLEAARFLLEKGADISLEGKIDGTPLFGAIKENMIAAVELILLREPDLWKADRGGTLPVEAAYHWFGDKKVFRLLLNTMDLDQGDEDGRTLLHRAALQCKPELAAILVRKGVSLEATDNYGNTAADLIKAHLSSAEAFRRLFNIPDDASANKTKVTKPSQAEILDQIRSDIADGKDINEKHPVGSTYLHRAANDEDIKVMKWLLENGANPDVVDNANNTPLHRAALGGNLEAVKLLLEHDCDVNVRGPGHLTPLEISLLWAEGNKKEIFTLLYPLTTILNDLQIMKKVAVRSEFELYEILLDAGFDVNMPIFFGERLVHIAVVRRDMKLLKMVLERGANVELRDDHGLRAYDYLENRDTTWAKEAKKVLSESKAKK